MNPTTIFLSYAREDAAVVKDLYRKLRKVGFEPWMDKPPEEFLLEGLEPGVAWDAEIRKRIKTSDCIIVFFSENSISKTGYIQREYRMVLDQLAQTPVDQTKQISVVLGDCSPPSFQVDTVSFYDRHFHYCNKESDLTMLVDFLLKRFGCHHYDVIDVAAHSYGVIRMDEQGHPVVMNIILADQALPTMAIMHTKARKQEHLEMKMEIMQNSSKASQVELSECKCVGIAFIIFGQLVPEGELFELRFSLETNALLSVEGIVLSSGRSVGSVNCFLDMST